MLLCSILSYSQTTSIKELLSDSFGKYQTHFYRVSGNYTGIGEQIFILQINQKMNLYQPININDYFEIMNTIVRGYITLNNNVYGNNGIPSNKLITFCRITYGDEGADFYTIASLVEIRTPTTTQRGDIYLAFIDGALDLKLSKKYSKKFE